MKKQLFYLYKLGIVRSVMTAYFISWKDEKLWNGIKINAGGLLASRKVQITLLRAWSTREIMKQKYFLLNNMNIDCESETVDL